MLAKESSIANPPKVQILMKNGIKFGYTALTQTAEELAVILVPSATIDLPSGNNGKHCWHSWISQCFYGN